MGVITMKKIEYEVFPLTDNMDPAIVQELYDRILNEYSGHLEERKRRGHDDLEDLEQAWSHGLSAKHTYTRQLDDIILTMDRTGISPAIERSKLIDLCQYGLFVWTINDMAKFEGIFGKMSGVSEEVVNEACRAHLLKRYYGTFDNAPKNRIDRVNTILMFTGATLNLDYHDIQAAYVICLEQGEDENVTKLHQLTGVDVSEIALKRGQKRFEILHGDSYINKTIEPYESESWLDDIKEPDSKKLMKIYCWVHRIGLSGFALTEHPRDIAKQINLFEFEDNCEYTSNDIDFLTHTLNYFFQPEIHHYGYFDSENRLIWHVPDFIKNAREIVDKHSDKNGYANVNQC